MPLDVSSRVEAGEIEGWLYTYLNCDNTLFLVQNAAGAWKARETSPFLFSPFGSTQSMK